MQNAKIKVLYIAGFERSGSTIINRVLGQIEGFVAWGELRDIWQHGIIENRLCTCGELFLDCPEWQKIFDQAFGGVKSVDAVKMFQLQRKIRNSSLFYYLGLLPKESFKKMGSEYFKHLAKLYDAIQAITGSRVIVDSTKASWYGFILGMLPNIDLYVVHVVRSPQGVCHSLAKRKIQGEKECQWYNPFHASLSWNLKNSGVEILLNHPSKHYSIMRYEDFICNPKTTVESILSFLKEPLTSLPFEDEYTVKMSTDHIITGSPSSRSQTGTVQLNLDQKWKTDMTIVDKTIIESLTFFLRNKYGYLI